MPRQKAKIICESHPFPYEKISKYLTIDYAAWNGKKTWRVEVNEEHAKELGNGPQFKIGDCIQIAQFSLRIVDIYPWMGSFDCIRTDVFLGLYSWIYLFGVRSYYLLVKLLVRILDTVGIMKEGENLLMMFRRITHSKKAKTIEEVIAEVEANFKNKSEKDGVQRLSGYPIHECDDWPEHEKEEG